MVQSNGTGRLDELSMSKDPREEEKEHVHNQSLVVTIHGIGKDNITSLVFSRRNVECPQETRDLDEHAVVRDVTADTDPPSEAVGQVALVLCVRNSRGQLAVFGEMSFRAEFVSVWAVHIWIVVEVPDVDNADGVLGEEVALVVVVLGETMGDAERSDTTPAHDFLDQGANVWEVFIVVKGWEAVTADNLVDLFLCAFLGFGVENHGLNPPGHLTRGGFSTGSTEKA